VVTWTQHLAEASPVGSLTRRKLSAKRAFKEANENARRQGFIQAIELAKALDYIDSDTAEQLIHLLDESK
jgi:hypothetical protein